MASARVPDLNRNGYAEDALLYVDYKTGVHRVVIRDRKTPHNAIGTIRLTFAKSYTPPKGLAVLADTNGNKYPEIGVLDQSSSGNTTPVVRVKDLSSNAAYLRSIAFFNSQYRPVSLAVEPDGNGNGAYELTVTAVHKDTGKIYTETRDSKTGAWLYSNAF